MSEEELEVAEESFKVSEEGGRKGRGPNKEWFDSESFKDGKEYNESVFKRHLDEQMSKKSMAQGLKYTFVRFPKENHTSPHHD